MSVSKVIVPKLFSGLHGHSCGSSGDGFGLPSEHIDYVLSTGGDSLTLTDHGNGNCLAHAYAHASKLQKKGVKYRQLYGVEFYFVPSLTDWRHQYDNRHALAELAKNITSESDVESVAKITDEDGEEEVGLVLEDEDATRKIDIDTNEWKRRYHLVVIAKSQKGLENLFTLVKKSYKDGFYRYPRIDYELLKQHGEGLVVSTACMGGYLANIALRGEAMLRPASEIQTDMLNAADRFVDAVGVDNFFLELQFNKLDGQHTVNKHLLDLHDRTGIRLISTADSHYPSPDKWQARELYRKLCRLNMFAKDKDSPDNYALPKFEDLKCELYPKNAEQMWNEYLSHRDAYQFYEGRDQLVADSIERTHEIAWELCDGSWIDTSAKLPNFTTPDRTAFGQLTDLVKTGLTREGLDKDPVYVARAKRELGDIKLKGFENYFLTLYKVMQKSKQRVLFGSGRGSGAGSIVNYVLDITDIDPLKYNLLWERFVNIGRCLRGSTLALTNQGPRLLTELAIGDMVLTKLGRWRPITEIHTRKTPIRLAITVKGERIICSDNHKWITHSPLSGDKTIPASMLVADHHGLPVIDPASFLQGKFRTPSVTISGVEWLPSEEEELIDLTVAEDESFFVSETGNYFVLTHNSSFPDIDTDVSDRDILIEDAKELFGDSNVIPVSNFNTMKLKSLVKDISKFYQIPFEEVNEVTGQLQQEVEPNVRTDADEKSTFVLKHDDCMEHSVKYKDFMDRYPQVESQVKDLFGQFRSVGRHAGGVLICPDLEKYMPVITVRGETQTPWTEGVNIRNLEENGFLKFDFLGLSTMEMVEDCIRRILIKEGNPEPRFSDILYFFNESMRCRANEPQDPVVFKHVFKEGRFCGIFQLQSAGARLLCQQISPNNIDELAAMTALYRPGPLKNGSHTKYLYAKANPDTMSYRHPAIEEVLKETFGQIIFQEQFILLAQKLANFSPTDADKLRKTLVKKDITTADKRGPELEKAHKQFVAGAIANNCPESEAKRVWQEIERQALYCFNKSHSVAYAVDSYYSGWLHTYYEHEWLATVLESAKDPEELMTYINEVKQQGYNMAQIDINHSGVQWEFSDELQAFVPPLSSMKGVAAAATEEIVALRPYTSLDNLFYDAEGKFRLSKFNKTALRALVLVEGMSSLDDMSSGRIANHAQLFKMLFDDKNFELIKKGRILKAKKGMPPNRPTLDVLREETALTPAWSRHERIANYSQTCSSVDNSVIYPDRILSRLEGAGFVPITTVDPAAKKVSVWFLVLQATLKLSKNNKRFYRLKVSDNTNKTTSLMMWGVREDTVIEPYTIWAGHVDGDPKWGPSTFLGSVRLAPGIE